MLLAVAASRHRTAVSLAWVVGPPLAMLIMGVFGPRSVVVLLAFVAVLNIATTMFLMQQPPINRPSRRH